MNVATHHDFYDNPKSDKQNAWLDLKCIHDLCAQFLSGMSSHTSIQQQF